MGKPKVLIQNHGPLGGTVEQVELDTNRVNVQNETTARLANAIAFSSRGLWVDCSQWICYSAGFFSILKLAILAPTVPLWSVALGAGIPLWLFCILIADVCQRRKTLRNHAVGRFFLVFIGAAIAVI